MKAYIIALDYYLPDIIEENHNQRLRKKTGIERRHICPENMTAGDMAVIAAEKLFAQGIDRKAIDYLMLCTQSPDYYLPTTACMIQDRLGLSTNCGALDFNLGCSGFVYGLGLAKGLIESGQAHNVLLLTSETYSKYINPEDNSVRSLFGDAASAVLVSGIESDSEGISGMVYGTDGKGAEYLIVPVGGSRNDYEHTPVETFRDHYGNLRTNRNLYMNGQAITNFALDAVPPMLEAVLTRTSLSRKDIDYFVFHQANRMMIEALRERCALKDSPCWEDVSEYGNTVSSSIAIAAKDMLNVRGSRELGHVMLIGFGVGLSWGGCIADFRRVKPFRDKREDYLILEGPSVILEEIRPEYFPHVISWRNDKRLNPYINQPHELTLEAESRWYEEVYLPDVTQGFMVMIDRESMTPFATLGWTDYDAEKRQCICGRLIVSDPSYGLRLMEGNIILMDYLYRFVDVMYAHVGVNNSKALNWDFSLGFEMNTGEWEYPSEARVNDIDQCEIVRTFERYREARTRLIKRFGIELSEEPVVRLSKRHNSQSIMARGSGLGARGSGLIVSS